MDQMTLTPKDFAKLFSATESEIVEMSQEYYNSEHYTLRRLSDKERDAQIHKFITKIDSVDLKVSGEARREDWEKGWAENLSDLQKGSSPEHSVIPKYFRPGKIFRFYQDYFVPVSADFEKSYTEVYVAWLLRKYFIDTSAFYEFGCGPGSHVFQAAKVFPDRPVVGLDWAKSSQEILKEGNRKFGTNVQAHNFDFFNPNYDIQLQKDAGVLTFGALEQVGERFVTFYEYLKHNKPKIVVHAEGIEEFYDPSELFGYLRKKYHQKKGYLKGFLTFLKNKEEAGEIEIIKTHHQDFGNPFDDTYSLIVWRFK